MQLKLTSKEKLVLYGLARYPGLSDIDLAAKIGVDRSTIFKSKRKFRDWQLIKLFNVPSGVGVGAELLTAVVVRFNPTAPFEVRSQSNLTDRWIGHPDCVFHISSDTDSISMLYSRSLTDLKESMDPLVDDYQRNGFIDDISYIQFPFLSTQYCADSAIAIERIFELERNDLPEDTPRSTPANEDYRLTDKDKLTLYAFVKYPMLSDLELSRRTGISRPTISGKRTKFFQSSLLGREAYVEWQKICCELMSFYHIKIKHNPSGDDQIAIYASLRRMGAPLYSYLQPGEVFGSFLSHSYTDLKKRMDLELRIMAQEGLLMGKPVLITMPLESIKETKVDYAPMVKRMLQIDKEI